MKVKHLSALAGLAGTALIASPASAGFAGFSIEVFDVGVDHANPTVRAAWNGGGGAGLTSYRVYATFDSTGDIGASINALFGDSGRRAFLSVSGTIFNFDGLTTHGSPAGPFNTPSYSGGDLTSEPQRGWDTFVSIGRFAADSLTQLSPDFGTFTNNLGSSWDSDVVGDIAWFVTPTPSQAIVDASLRVLVMQLTVSSGSFVQGNFGIQVDADGSGTGEMGIDIHDDIGFGGISYFEIPSPGAFALLGLAGLTGVRRRRRH